MRHVLILSTVISALIFTLSSCTPRYTCKQARTHCTECLMPASEMIPVPYTVMDRALPLSCTILLTRDPFINKVGDSGNAGKDLRELSQTYRKNTDDNIKTAEMIKECRKDLEEQEKSIRSSAEAYCGNLGTVYASEKQACVPVKDQ